MSTEKKDDLGRTWSTVCGWLGGPPLPIGSRVRILASRFGSSVDHFFVDYVAVVMTLPAKLDSSYDKKVVVRMVDPVAEWEPGYYSCTKLAPERLELLSIGDGEAISGRDFKPTKLEIARERYAALDLTYQNYSNAPTYLAALYLRSDATHCNAVLGMARKDGTVNPARLMNYFYKQGLKIDEWAHLPETFPNHDEFRQHPNWPEVAKDFEDLLTSMRTPAMG